MEMEEHWLQQRHLYLASSLSEMRLQIVLRHAPASRLVLVQRPN